jgi:hypothetical protein
VVKQVCELLEDRCVPSPYTAHPTPYTLHPTPYPLPPTPYILPSPRQSRRTGCQQSILCARQWFSNVETASTRGLATVHPFLLSGVTGLPHHATSYLKATTWYLKANLIFSLGIEQVLQVLCTSARTSRGLAAARPPFVKSIEEGQGISFCQKSGSL